MVQLSDLHCGTQFFLPNLLERAIAEVNELDPDVVIVSGDLTTHGFKDEYALAKRYLDTIECESIVVIPGNHDSRNVGYVHFEELFGDRNSVLRSNGVAIVAVDSTEPDLDNGQIGRGRYRWIGEQFSEPADLRVFVLHHHLLPVPMTATDGTEISWNVGGSKRKSAPTYGMPAASISAASASRRFGSSTGSSDRSTAISAPPVPSSTIGTP